ncbi:MAG: hypothetical protein DDT21_00353 [Syntrophomonadaceae bacterium]|nr:hypothetical protein [Bacillota bacterium]
MLGLIRSNVDLTIWVITGGIKTEAGKGRVIQRKQKTRKHETSGILLGGASWDRTSGLLNVSLRIAV